MSVNPVPSAWSVNARDFDNQAGFHQLFEARSRATPDAIALADAQHSLSYRQLAEKSTQLAAYLAGQGVGSGSRVAIFMNRSLDLVLAMLAIARVGATYIPLDPAYPEQRLRYMLEDSDSRWVLTQAAVEPRLAALLGEHCCSLALDRQWPLVAACQASLPEPALAAGSLAYIIYTSGSTGQPKGVMISHRALSNFLLSMAEEPGMSAADTLLAVTTHCFDISGLELLLPLVVGARCHICPAETAGDASQLMSLIARVRPSLMQATPATWMMLFHAGWQPSAQLRMFCGGEPLSDALKSCFEQAGNAVWNMYGPTETTIWSTLQKLEPGQPVSIGRPIANTRLYLLREDGSHCAIGEPGELCIAGAGLAEGYLNRPDLTAEKFIDHTLETSGKLYRTGDLACWQADGLLQHLGRIDNQVKIRGYRVEVGDIEAQLDSHPEVLQAVVVARQQAGSGQLVGYFVPREPNVPDSSLAGRLKTWLGGQLPDFMVPNFLVAIERLPLTPNGKVDRKLLAQRPISLAPGASAAGQGDVERYIIEQWQALLGVEDIQPDSLFAEIGGNSISANAFLARLNQRFDTQLVLADLARHASPTAIAQRLLAHPQAAPASMAQAPAHSHRQASQGDDARQDIAIVGMACSFAQAPCAEAFWDNILAGRNCVTSAALMRPQLVRDDTPLWAGFIADAFDFDPVFFQMAPKEAHLIDPQQRLMLTYTWRALEDAGISAQAFSQRRTGVFIAAAQNDYAVAASHAEENKGYLATAQLASMVANRLSYSLDLFGPSECVETTCSSSLVALHRAIRAIRHGECEQAVVGGVNLLLSAEYFHSYNAMGLLSPDQSTRSFQAGANGYVRSEGAAVVILKSLARALADNDRIAAVIKGSSVNHGGRSASLTAPSQEGMRSAMLDALADAGVAPNSLGYIETHATGSLLGDSVEVSALEAVFAGQGGPGSATPDCTLGSLKPCIGHSEVACGMAALIKVVFALQQGIKPGVPGVTEEDGARLCSSGVLRISAQNQPWADTAAPRRAAINSYGFGVNAHVIVEQYCPPEDTRAEDDTAHLLVFSAKTPAQLATVLENQRAHLHAHPQVRLRDLAYTLQVGREALKVRLAFVVRSIAEACEQLARALEGLSAGAAAWPSGIFHSDRHLGADDELGAMAAQWVAGAAQDWHALHPPGSARKLALPHYPFQFKTYNAWAKDEPAPPAGPGSRRICVIGAGPGGLVMAKSLLEEGHRPVVYEAQDTLGGVWNLKRDKEAGTYSTTRFQNSRDTSFFSDFYPEDISDTFPDVHDVRRYLQAYATRFDLERHIHCKSRVVAVRAEGDGWQVEIESGGTRRQETFDGVALCHGRYQIPQHARIPGLETFTGQVLHSGQYFDNAPLAGKRVLVIGNGVSGMDIAGEASKVAAKVYWSLRSRKFILPRMVGFLPNDFVSPANLLIPDALRAQRNIDRLQRVMPAFSEALQRSGLQPTLNEFRQHPFIHINDEVVELVDSGKIETVFGQVERFAGARCFHVGHEQALEDIDVVVLCTGYRTGALYDYVQGLEPTRDLAMGLFYRDDPRLFNQYGLQEIGVIGTFPYLEMASRWYAQVVSGKYWLSQQELQQTADTDKIIMGPLASVVIGMKLGLVPDPVGEFKAFWSLLNTPCFPGQYRLRGPHASAGAAAIVAASRKRAFIQDETGDLEISKVKARLLAGLGSEAVASLAAQGQITAEEQQAALAQLDNPLRLDWDSQFLTPLSDRALAIDQATESLDRVIAEHDRLYLGLIRKIRNKEINADNFLSELKKISRAS
ncbi:amino acid adenylation domain-containing protein [Pseudomonas sp. LAMO17WK12:I10]|uniref:amino acid adenylation domain-containing protein n=1 Tax=unclassified Pseudomonas TaxID=196821 RepID=UPI000BD230C8|nr:MULTISPECIES: amino acid adenylation domain-containing protein [unclassified Pseudomonas]PXX69492.1 polyketide synthase PksJ [Pseudomonas sp. LAMO17WK12:I9]SNY32787.1 amino acid adenylation domain-containing protein [Pseudomonas sp. LAMO17WK12:I10]